MPALFSGDEPNSNSKFFKSLETTTDKIKFHLNFDNIEEGVKDNEITFVKDVLVPMATLRLSEILSVTGSHEIGPLKAGSCQDSDIPNVKSTYYDSTTEGDMIIFVGIRKLNSGILAYSATCAQDPSSFRPIASQVIFNSVHADPNDHFLLNSYATLLHEILHGMVFNPALYTYFKKVDGGSAYFLSGGSYYLIGNEIVNQSKAHFGCDSLDSLKMENEGDSGSSGAHFERLHFGNETMVSEDVENPILSIFTLALLKDSGFYTVDMDKAQTYEWGRNKGCSFLKENICGKSGEYSEICTEEGSLDCDVTHNFVTKCKATKFTNSCLINDIKYGCQIPYSYEDFKDEVSYASKISHFGKEAKCMKYSDEGDPKVTCMDVRCAADQNSYTIYFSEDTFFKCEKKDHVITYSDYTIKCLDPIEFCGIKEVCSDNCNFNGECLLDGTCHCNPFYSGDSCQNFTGCPVGLESICEDILDKNQFSSVKLLGSLVNFLIYFCLINN